MNDLPDPIETVADSKVEPSEARKVPVILTSVNGPLRDIFDDVEESAAETTEFVDDASTTKSYVLCFVERSGSTMLTDVMKKTRVLGIPDEYVNPRGPMLYTLKRFPAKDLSQYFRKLRRKCATPNGVFGMKTIYHDFQPLIEAGIVSALLGAPNFIYLTRKDVVLQAISSYLARMRGLWHSSDRLLKMNENVNFDEMEVPFDREEILKLVDRFMNDRLRWERFFSLYNIEPLRIEYEDLVPNNISHELQRICEFIGIDSSLAEADISTSLEILRDERSAEWAERIRNEFQL